MSGIYAHFVLRHSGFELDAGFDAPARGVTALFGPSGSGKTTVLRCLAGLERASGQLQVNGEIWQSDAVFVPPHRRAVGYVFQEASLFPHLSVRENLLYGYRRIPAAERRVQLDQVVEWLGLVALIERRDPNSLSGGERQRVAIARALLTSPRLLLMDEPLSALDGPSKQEILAYLETLHCELDIPVVYVTHAMEEVTRLADHLVYLQQGRVKVAGALLPMLSQPDSPLAKFEEAAVVIEVSVGALDEPYQLARLDFSGGALWVTAADLTVGRQLRARVQARDVSITLQPPQASSINNILPATIVALAEAGSARMNVQLLTGANVMLLARITRRSCDTLGLMPGMAVYAQIKTVALAV
ncbi:MAG: molybdenum ABC transporter ATP-binding protein [Gallionella sp.]|jgi:molybdate transport system ATP-binding protein|nr:molybdenum ABC transporter ATP-binding protein [Gallionella sp.]